MNDQLTSILATAQLSRLNGNRRFRKGDLRDTSMSRWPHVDYPVTTFLNFRLSCILRFWSSYLSLQ